MSYLNVLITLFLGYYIFSKYRPLMAQHFYFFKRDIKKCLSWIALLLLPLIVVVAGLYFIPHYGYIDFGYYSSRFIDLYNNFNLLFWILIFIFTIVIEPFITEIIFRGIIYAHFAQSHSKTNSIIFTSLVYAGFSTVITLFYAFTSANIELLLWFPLFFLLHFLFGILLSFVVAKTSNIISAIVLHSISLIPFFFIFMLDF